jgi:hypothetical protein
VTLGSTSFHGWALYDGGCGLCSHGMSRWGRHLRRLGVLPVPLQTPILQERSGLSPAELSQAFTILDRNGSCHRGLDAYLWLLALRPGGIRLAHVLAQPPLRQLLQPVVALLMARRRQISSICGLQPTPHH